MTLKSLVIGTLLLQALNAQILDNSLSAQTSTGLGGNTSRTTSLTPFTGERTDRPPVATISSDALGAYVPFPGATPIMESPMIFPRSSSSIFIPPGPGSAFLNSSAAPPPSNPTGGLNGLDVPDEYGGGGSPGSYPAGYPGWSEEDNGYYDGEDFNGSWGAEVDPVDEECPSWCFESDGGYDSGYGEYDGYTKRSSLALNTKNQLSRRSNFGIDIDSALGKTRAAVPSSGGFQGFVWPDASAKSSQSSAASSNSQSSSTGPYGVMESFASAAQEDGKDDYQPYGNRYPYEESTTYPYDSQYDQNTDYDDMGDDDLPDWLKTLPDNARPCPESCYKPATSSTLRSTSTHAPYTRTSTRRSYTRTYTSTRSSLVTSTSTSDPYPPSPTDTESPVSPTSEEPYPTETSPTGSPTSYTPDPTTMLTSTINNNGGGGGGGYTPSPNNINDPGWTGDTLSSICPATCNPFDPALNKCDPSSTGCVTTGGKNYYCACRAGYKASAYVDKDFARQFHVGGQPYVYVAPGTKCDKLCGDQLCSEVLVRDQCK